MNEVAKKPDVMLSSEGDSKVREIASAIDDLISKRGDREKYRPLVVQDLVEIMPVPLAGAILRLVKSEFRIAQEVLAGELDKLASGDKSDLLSLRSSLGRVETIDPSLRSGILKYSQAEADARSNGRALTAGAFCNLLNALSRGDSNLDLDEILISGQHDGRDFKDLFGGTEGLRLVVDSLKTIGVSEARGGNEAEKTREPKSKEVIWDNIKVDLDKMFDDQYVEGLIQAYGSSLDIIFEKNLFDTPMNDEHIQAVREFMLGAYRAMGVSDKVSHILFREAYNSVDNSLKCEGVVGDDVRKDRHFQSCAQGAFEKQGISQELREKLLIATQQMYSYLLAGKKHKLAELISKK